MHAIFIVSALHGVGLPWASAIVASGIALRLLTAPLHVYSEKLMAKRLHAQNFFTSGILKVCSSFAFAFDNTINASE